MADTRDLLTHLPDARAESGEYRVALLGDIHLHRLPYAPWSMLGKRALGIANLLHGRRNKFQPHLMEAVIRRILARKPHAVWMTGDLTTLSTRAEFTAARQLIQPLCEQVPTILVPGNHDCYTFWSTWRKRAHRAWGSLTHMPEPQPLVQNLPGGWRLLAIDSCAPRIITSRGRITRPTIDAVNQLLDSNPMTEHSHQQETAPRPNGDVSNRPKQRLAVLCHYPIVVPPYFKQKWQHRLIGAAQLARQLLGHPNTERLLFMHGHIHMSWLIPGNQARCVDGSPIAHSECLADLNLGSPTMVATEHPHGQGFWEIIFPNAGPADRPPLICHHFPGSLVKGDRPEDEEWLVSEHPSPWPGVS